MKSLTKVKRVVAGKRPDLRLVPAEVQLSLPVAGVLRDVHGAFLGVCVNAGKRVLAAMMESERTALCGKSGVPDPERRACRGGHTHNQVVLGGRRIGIVRPRARLIDEGELALPTYAWAAGADPINAVTLAAIAAGVSGRRYQGTLDRLPAQEWETSVSKSAVSRRFVELSGAQLHAWLNRPIDFEAPVVMIDGIHLGGRVVLVALGFDARGKKHVLGLHEGNTENTRVVRTLLSQLVERGLKPDTARLWVIDGSKALRRAIMDLFGETSLVQRCQVHKRRNVIDHLPEALHASVGRALTEAWDTKDVALARRQLERLANSLAKTHPGAAASLREGLEETLTVTALGIDEALYRSLRSTNAVETLNGLIALYARNVKRWKDGNMVLRWVGGALHNAGRSFRAVRGYREMKSLITAIKREVADKFKDVRKVA